MESYQLLEREFATWNRLDPAGMVACSSGTAALHLALESLKLPPGSEVIVPDFTMVAVPRAVVLAGCVPVFVDCDPVTLNMDTEQAGRVVSSLTSAVVAVHTYGRQLNVSRLVGEVYKKAPLFVIEDLAEAHGVSPHHETSAACWSFYRNKIVHGEEGGAVWFPNLEWASRAVSLRSLGFTEDHDFIHVPRGHNYRLSNANATLVRRSLASVQHHTTRRQQIVATFEHHCPADWKMTRREALWVYDLRLSGIDYSTQTRVVKALQTAGIPARHAFKPMHTMEEFSHCKRIGGEVAERMSREVIYLPIRPLEKDEERAAEIFDIVRGTLKS